MAKIEFRTATAADAEWIGGRLRSADRAEVEALGQIPERAPADSLRWSDAAWTGLIDGEVAMVFGCGGSLLADAGVVWALGTDLCTRHPREMLRFGRFWIRKMLELFPVLENWCDARYEGSLRWLRAIGCEVGEPEPHGPNRALFCKLTIRKEA